MHFIPKRPTLDEIVSSHGGLENYLTDPEQVRLNNGYGYHEIMLLLKGGVSATARETKRNKKTVYRWMAIRDREEENAKSRS